MDNPEKIKKDAVVWSGRDDTANEGPTAKRWHQGVKTLTEPVPGGIVLQGFACDIGVRRNDGRVGAANGPPILRKALSRLAWHQDHPVYDAGDIPGTGSDLKGAQELLAVAVAKLVGDGHRPIVLGGGHETSWGTFQGLTRARPGATVGIINIDAHFDLRSSNRPNSGTPFHQVATWCQANELPFLYLVIGISESSNTVALFDHAKALGARWTLDCEPVSAASIVQLIDQCELVHLSLDLDVLPAHIMPAVSAPAGRGLDLPAVELALDLTLSSGKVAAVDVVEFNPAHDLDSRGSRAAAALIWRIARNWRVVPRIEL